MRTATFSASDDIGVGHPFIWAHTESGSDRVPCGKWFPPITHTFCSMQPTLTKIL